MKDIWGKGNIPDKKRKEKSRVIGEQKKNVPYGWLTTLEWIEEQIMWH